ncbi:MAG: SCO family protein [Bacteroidota bacterium]
MTQRSLFSLSCFCVLVVFLLTACTQEEKQDSLPILGFREVVNGDTVYHKIKDFEFVDQDSNRIVNATFKDKLYVTDFFFTSCPTICPKVKQQMLRIYDKFAEEDRLVLLSHSIDVRRDTVATLKRFAQKLEVDGKRWHFVTGEEDHIYDMADDYFVVAQKDPNAPGGFDHSGKIILVDPDRYVRSFADGTDPESVDRLLLDIQQLLDETAGQ